MSFTKKTFVDGDTLYAADLNGLEDQIEENAGTCAGLSSALGYTPDGTKKLITIDPAESNPGKLRAKNGYVYSTPAGSYKKYEIEAGVVYYITGASASDGAAYPAACFCGTDGKTVIGTYGTDKNTVYTDLEVEAPAESAILFVNGSNGAKVLIKKYVPMTGCTVLDGVLNDMDTIKEKVDVEVTPGKIITSTETITGKVYDVLNKKEYSTSASSHYAIYDGVSKGIYFVSGRPGAVATNYPLVACYDAAGNFLDSFGKDAKTYTDLEIEAPPNTARIIVNGANASGVVVPVELKAAAKKEDPVKYNLDMAAAMVRLAKRNPFAFDTIPAGGFVSFVFDDLCLDVDSVAAIFEAHSMPLGIAAIPDRAALVCNGLSAAKGSYTPGMTCQQVMNQVVADGGEIHVHNRDVVTISNQYDYDFMYDYYIKQRETLRGLGFNPRGIIHAGGQGAIKGTAEIEKWMIGNYEYGNGGTAPNFNLSRETINQPIEDLKLKITAAHTNGEWLRIMGHSYTYGDYFTTPEDLEAILSYCEEVGIPVVTYASVFDSYSSSVLEQLIKSNS